jgi:hypothetical protein
MTDQQTPLWYADPTGNKAVSNVMRELKGRPSPLAVAAVSDRVISSLIAHLERDLETYLDNKKALASVLEHRQGHAPKA